MSGSRKAATAPPLIEDGGRRRSSSRELSKPPAASSLKSVIYLLAIVESIEGADQQLLPATFHALEVDLGISPVGLGHMSLAQSLFMSLTAPFWGMLADRYSRKALLVFSSAAWGILTAALALGSSVELLIVLRCAHGAMLASLGPIAQSIVADITDEEQRGVGYGHLEAAKQVGAVGASLTGTALAMQTILGVRGWRFIFMAVAAVSVLFSLLLIALMEEPPRDSGHRLARHNRDHDGSAGDGVNGTRSGSWWQGCRDEASRVASLFCIPTFVVIVVQGLLGSIPWNSFGFIPMYLLYCGHNDATAAVVYTAQLVGGACGGILGGLIGDSLARKSPHHGRACTAQISVVAGIPFIAAMLFAAPRSSGTPLTILSFGFGVVASWCSPGVNLPILSEIVDPSLRATIVAWLTSLQGSSAALFGAPVVGYLSENVFHYRKGMGVTKAPSKPPHQRAGAPPATLEAAAALHNAIALRNSMMVATVIPFSLCFCLYSLLHCTYNHDVVRARSFRDSHIEEATESGLIEITAYREAGGFAAEDGRQGSPGGEAARQDAVPSYL